MKKSIFRFIDRLELCTAYLFCFIFNFIIDYTKSLNFKSYILESFIKNFIVYQTIINVLFAFIVVVWHYKIINRKRVEISCRILIGDTISNITIRYIFECMIILTSVFLLSIFTNIYFNFNLTNNIYLFCIFNIYILFSASKVRHYENF